MFERIVVSVDGSPDSDKAVEVARELARAQGSEVIVVHGRDIALVSPPGPPTPEPSARSHTTRPSLVGRAR